MYNPYIDIFFSQFIKYICYNFWLIPFQLIKQLHYKTENKLNIPTYVYMYVLKQINLIYVQVNVKCFNIINCKLSSNLL